MAGDLVSGTIDLVNDLKKQTNNRRSEIAAIKRKMERLEDAKKKLKKLKAEAKDIKKSASKKNMTKKLGLKWKGDNYDDYVEFLEDVVKQDFENYVNAIDDRLDSIIDAINRCDDELQRKTTILSGLGTRLNDLGYGVQKIFN